MLFHSWTISDNYPKMLYASYDTKYRPKSYYISDSVHIFHQFSIQWLKYNAPPCVHACAPQVINLNLNGIDILHYICDLTKLIDIKRKLLSIVGGCQEKEISKKWNVICVSKNIFLLSTFYALWKMDRYYTFALCIHIWIHITWHRRVEIEVVLI